MSLWLSYYECALIVHRNYSQYFTVSQAENLTLMEDNGRVIFTHTATVDQQERVDIIAQIYRIL